jgi:putative transposase
MARLRRYALPGQPQHVIQRGNNRVAIFSGPADYERLRDDIAEVCLRYECFVHAYVLMLNHFHLLMTARDKRGVSKAMQALGPRYVGYFNRRHQRTGTLWEGRYRSVPIDSERYLFTCYRYIEQNPVRAGIVADPDNYRWSSFRANAMGEPDPLVTPHERYLALGGDALDRLATYRAICAVPFDGVTLNEVRSSTHKSWALGDAHFRAAVTKATGRRATPYYEQPMPLSASILRTSLGA